MRKNKYEKIGGEELKNHKKPFDSKIFKDHPIAEWERNTGQVWPTQTRMTDGVLKIRKLTLTTLFHNN